MREARWQPPSSPSELKSYLEHFILEKDGGADKQSKKIIFALFGQRAGLFALYRTPPPHFQSKSPKHIKEKVGRKMETLNN